MDMIKRKLSYCRYGLLFIIGVFFGSIGMFYRSFDMTRHILETPLSYVWSESEQTYVPFQNNRLTSLTPSAKSPSSVQFVLILSYMRSGSSFTADVIQHHPDAFYAFEPLMSLVHEKRLTFLNGTQRNFTNERAILKESLNVLERWYNCDLYNLDLHTFKSIFMSFGIHTNQFDKCVGKTKRRANMMKCLPNLVKACKNSKLRVIKTIRVNVKDIREYFKKFPNFKLIHLVRDPRGVMNSRFKVQPKDYSKHEFPQQSRYLCYEMATDMNNTFQLAKEFPKRVTVLQYEDLAENPYSTSARLYTFLDSSVTLEIYGYIYHITSTGTSTERAYGVGRSNSKWNANRWKSDLKYSEIKVIDLECKNYYNVLGYLPVTNSSFLNANNSLATRVHVMNMPIK